jgi:gamma-glutamyltranspeptidase/glutathione hydrolase
MEAAVTVTTWHVDKRPAVSAGGIVAAQSRRAAEVGAEVLRAGGNAVDAVIATSLALAALEPWMSGLGGGGCMLVWLAGEGRARALDFGMVAPRRLDPAHYPLVGGAAGDLFGWPAVLEDRNLHGPLAVAVPGQADGLRLAHERFATLPFAELAAPAVALAEEGLEVDWHASL